MYTTKICDIISSYSDLPEKYALGDKQGALTRLREIFLYIDRNPTFRNYEIEEFNNFCVNLFNDFPNIDSIKENEFVLSVLDIISEYTCGYSCWEMVGDVIAKNELYYILDIIAYIPEDLLETGIHNRKIPIVEYVCDLYPEYKYDKVMECFNDDVNRHSTTIDYDSSIYFVNELKARSIISSDLELNEYCVLTGGGSK